MDLHADQHAERRDGSLAHVSLAHEDLGVARGEYSDADNPAEASWQLASTAMNSLPSSRGG
jgi:hypothetical protein